MAAIYPFNAVYFNKNKFGDISSLIAPPYDVITKQQQQDYYKKSKFNIIRAILPKENPSNSRGNDIYAGALEFLQNCEKRKILLTGHNRAIYIIEQSFKADDNKTYFRRGIICLLKLEKYEKKVVLPHEKTFLKHADHCLKLLINCKMEFNPIFSIFSDTGGAVRRWINRLMDKNCFLEVYFENEIKNTLWKVADTSAINEITELMKDKVLYIADGHHRYGTALKYMELNSGEFRLSTDNTLYNSTMICLVSMQDEGLKILPAHRIVKNSTNFSILSNPRVNQFFKIEKINIDKSLKKYITETLRKYGERNHVFGLYFGKKILYVLKLKDSPQNLITDRNVPEELKEVDTYILEELILKNLIGEIDYLKDITITHSVNEVLKYVDNNINSVGFILNPVKVSDIEDVCSVGELLPPKSTYFYPKMLSGLIMRKLQ